MNQFPGQGGGYGFGPGLFGGGSGGGGGGGGGFGGTDFFSNLYGRQSNERIARGVQQGETERARIAADASMYPATLKQQRFQGVSGTLQGMAGHDAFAGQLGDHGPGPQINVGPVWDAQQINRQVNNQRGINNASTQQQQQGLASSLGGRGFGSNSPLQLALSQGLQMSNMQNNTNADRGVRWDAAQGNAQHVLQSQQAREGQYANRQTEDIERRKGSNQFQSSLAAALASMV